MGGSRRRDPSATVSLYIVIAPIDSKYQFIFRIRMNTTSELRVWKSSNNLFPLTSFISRPPLVCEVRFDHFSGGRFRHGTKFLRWRPEKSPKTCTYEQVIREAKEKKTAGPVGCLEKPQNGGPVVFAIQG